MTAKVTLSKYISGVHDMRRLLTLGGGGELSTEWRDVPCPILKNNIGKSLLPTSAYLLVYAYSYTVGTQITDLNLIYLLVYDVGIKYVL